MDQRDQAAKEGEFLVIHLSNTGHNPMQIVDLESRLARALEEGPQGCNGASMKNGRKGVDWVPSSEDVPKLCLTGHRDKVNSVAFHPLYSVLVSGSDDCSLKVWDWETGTLERTISGHTKRITDCDFDSKGNQLGVFMPPLLWRIR
jgi:platelet-activating factor acetylhydrolase IB subunit alpha